MLISKCALRNDLAGISSASEVRDLRQGLSLLSLRAASKNGWLIASVIIECYAVDCVGCFIQVMLWLLVD